MEEIKAQALYDADAAQRVPLKIVQDGETYEVAHKFSNGIADDAVLDLIDALESQRSQALSAVWLEMISGFEGYETYEQESFSELAPHIPLDERVSAIDEGLLMAVIVVKKSGSKKPALTQRGGVVRHHLRAFFDGQFLDTLHALYPYDASAYRTWQKIKADAFPVQFGDHKLTSYGRACVALYDALIDRTEGYAGRVPAHHKVLVVEQHFDGQSAAVLAKKS